MSKLSLLRTSNPDTGSALHWALSSESLLNVDGDVDADDRTDVIQAMIEHVYDVNLRDGDGRTALMLAIKNNYDSAVRTLLEHPKIKIDQRDRDGRTILHHLFSYESEKPDDPTRQSQRRATLGVIYRALIRNPSIMPADLVNYRSVRGCRPIDASVIYKDRKVRDALHAYDTDPRWYRTVGRLRSGC